MIEQLVSVIAAMQQQQFRFDRILKIGLLIGLLSLWLSSHSTDSHADTSSAHILILQAQPDPETPPNTFYRVTLQQDGSFIREIIAIELALPPDQSITEAEWRNHILQQVTPLSGPRQFVEVPNSDGREVIFVMTGETDNFLNLYWLKADYTIIQLTHSENLIQESRSIISLSTLFIAWRPQHPTQFLFRTRLRDSTGQEANQLWLYDLATLQIIPAPYFGEFPTWSPNGNLLVGVRLDTTINPPLYRLWVENLLTHETLSLPYGCSPQWSPDGEWIAYHGHTNSQWQGYTACYADGNVYIIQLEKPVPIEVSAGLQEYITLIGWEK